ncbi:MAG TPA: hypothetical protein VEC57_07630 [Candidatus Limnocylindrales bacterium]|nr:hypothetical protein [Candidatus Limnocylindrales bacterium]
MHSFRFFALAAATLVLPLSAGTSHAVNVFGGGSRLSDCAVAFEVPGANKPAPPKAPKMVDCVDGDVSCDGDGQRNGECLFPLQLCINSGELSGCNPETVESITVDHAIDDGSDPRFDTDFQALQLRVNLLGLPSDSESCTTASSITVRLRGPDSSSAMKKNKKTLSLQSDVTLAAGSTIDNDKIKFSCRPEGDGIYLPVDLYEGTFDRIRDQVFAQTCAVSGCHDSESSAGDLILLPGAAYGNLVNAAPANNAAATDGLLRVTPGDPEASLLFHKLSPGLNPAYGSPMPLEGSDLDPALVEIIRLWIIGDGTLGPAPETGWVEGTDQ